MARCHIRVLLAARKYRGTVTVRVPETPNHGVTPGNKKPESERPRVGRGKFPRAGRLLRHADFERVYKLGRRHFSASMTVFYLLRQPNMAEPKVPAKGLRIGFTVGRALGGAVQRNRMKRRLREAVRLTRPPLGANADVVINPKKTVLTLDFESVLNEVRRALGVIEEKLGKP